ncbi:hypothetical protein BD770DRAFT_449965 [Pilaira anomala]|nr:hypothetical protein BD770DRAFT_449965 [Pilaira anomala]
MLLKVPAAVTSSKYIDKNSSCTCMDSWIENTKAMGDFGNEEYENMICDEVYVCNVADWVVLAG